MGLKDFGKLTKLTIQPENGGQSFEVMFNPESYSETFSTVYKKINTTNSGIEEYAYLKSLPQDFKLKIIIDGTGVSNYQDTFLPVFKKLDESVYDQVNRFLGLAWYPGNGKATSLVIKWNRFVFKCMLKDVTINYTLFSREGLPLRAELDANFIGNTEKNEEYYQQRLGPTVSDDKDTQKVNNGIVISVS